MEIAILSGKGGTGKTLVAANMARALGAAHYIDCDVEEPNGHLFFSLEDVEEERVEAMVPVLDSSKCSGCKTCVDICNFNALAYVGESLIIFDDICHSCGACSTLCPEGALGQLARPVGSILRARDGQTQVHTGQMDLGQASGTRIIKRMLEQAKDLDGPRLVDCPPGTACSVMDSIQGADYCLIVAESSIFGLENFKMVQELVDIFSKKVGVVVNKVLDGDSLIGDYCRQEGIEVLLELPFDRELGSLNAQGKLVVDEREDYRQVFIDLYDRIARRVEDEETTYP